MAESIEMRSALLEKGGSADSPSADESAVEKTSADELLAGRLEVHSCYFDDDMRRVDYILVFQVDAADADAADHERAQRRAAKRAEFERRMLAEGLQLEHAPVQRSRDGRTCFVKVHAPWAVLVRQAELLAIKMPIKMNDIADDDLLRGCVNSVIRRMNCLEVDPKYNVEEPDYFTMAFTAARADQFIMPEDANDFFSSSQRVRMVYEILMRLQYDVDRCDRIGIERLVENCAYSAAYPLHEELRFREWCHPRSLGHCWSEDGDAAKKRSDRQILYEAWARPKQLLKLQPLNKIRRYFGEKIALYFAWLGFYTKALIPAAIVGLVCVVYGALTLSEDLPTDEVCNASGAGNVTMCPNCIAGCSFWKLRESCDYLRITHIFDNTATVVFAVFMSIWASLFLEGWKRYHAEIAWEWDLIDFELEEETLRPEFTTRVRHGKRRVNPVTQQEEPFISFGERVGRVCASGASVLFFLCLVVAFVFGVIIYRIIVLHLLYREPETTAYASILTTASAAMLNLICILILGRVYQSLAWHLTNFEFPRTQSEFDNSYAFKVFLFQFINYYSSLFYIAFIKGRFTAVAGAEDDREMGGQTELFGHQLEKCAPGGCMVELVMQLAIIMVGKQIFSNCMEIGLPLLKNCWRARGLLRGKGSQSSLGEDEAPIPRWEADFALNPVPKQFLFDEYLEMIIQFGFVTLFVAAFPLAPLFALLNNVLEIRLDAYKFVATYRRPMPARAKDLGIWTSILDCLSKIAVFINACVIAFTSDFIPRMLYVISEGRGSLSGYTEWTLAYYNATRLPINDGADDAVAMCRFRDFRKPPCALGLAVDCDDRYGFSLTWWHVMAAKLAFVLVFEHVVFLVKGLVAYLIPDMPGHIFVRIQREQYLAKQALREYEMRVAAFRSVDKRGENGADAECVAQRRVAELGSVPPDPSKEGEDDSEVFAYNPQSTPPDATMRRAFDRARTTRL